MKRVIATIHEGFLTRYRLLNTYNREVGEKIDAILDKYADNDGTDNVIKLYKRSSEEDRARIFQILDENPVPGTIHYAKKRYQDAKEHRLENSEYSDCIVYGINMLIDAGIIRRADIED